MVRPDGSTCLLWLARQPLPLDRVKLQLAPSTQATPARRRVIDAHWRHVTTEDPRAFNGALANLKGHVFGRKAVMIRANRTDYKTYSWVRANPAYQLFDHGIAVMGSSCVLVTKDARVVLARRGRGLHGAGQIVTVPGGLFNVGDRAFDLEAHLRAEAREELALEEIDEILFHGIGYDAFFAKGAEMLFSLRTPLTAAAVIRGHRRAVDRHESTGLFSVPRGQVESYAVRHRHELLDGGTAALLAVAAHSGSKTATSAACRLTLREPRRTDFDAVLAMRNDPVAVRYSKRGRKVGRAEYWSEIGPGLLRRNRDTVFYMIAERDGRTAGYLRFDRGNGRAEVSIALVRRARGRGLGTAALKMGCARAFRDLKLRRITAVIHRANTASLRAFERAGFVHGRVNQGLASYDLVAP